jgi:hypothetical protein
MDLNIIYNNLYMFLISALFGIGIGINYLFKYTYPAQHEQALLTIIYQFIYYYSYIEMFYLKIYKKVKFNNTNNTNKNNSIEFVKNGLVIYTTHIQNQQQGFMIEKHPKEYDFIIYSDVRENITNKSIHYSLPQEWNYSISEIKFILFDIILDNNNKVSLSLIGPTYNYYVCDNIIDDMFLWYFLNKHYNLKLTHPLTNYKLNIIDNNVNMNTIIYPKCFKITHNKIHVLNLLSDSSDSDSHSDSHSDSDSDKIMDNDMEVEVEVDVDVDLNLDTNADIYMDNDMYALE